MQEAISNNFKISIKLILFSLLLLLARITSELLRYYKHLKTQLSACLLALLAGQPCFYRVRSLVVLMIGLAIDKTELIGRKVAVSFFGWFL